MAWRKEIRKAWSRLTDRNVLTALANRYGSDKGTRRYEGHHYTRVYDELFRPFRDAPIRLLELGLLNSRDYRSWTRRGERHAGTAAGARAPSLEMWSRYFPRASIVGFDINDFSAVALPRCTIVRGDMGSRQDLALAADLGPFDIIIDDASHASHHQQIALGVLFEHLRPGGLYIIEDLRWQPPFEPAGAIKTLDLLRRAAVTGEFASPIFLPAERSHLERDVESVSLFDSLAKGAIENADALAVIKKRR